MEGPSRSPHRKPAGGAHSAATGKLPSRNALPSSKPLSPVPARKPSPVKPLRIEPEPEPKSQVVHKPAPHPIPKRISSRAPAPKLEIENEPKIVPQRVSGRATKPEAPKPEKPEPPAEPAVKPTQAEAIKKTQSKREAKAVSVSSAKVPGWASKKVAGVLIALIVILSGTAVTLAVKIRAKNRSTTAQGGQRDQTGDVHDSDTPGNVVHQVNLSGKLKLPRIHTTSHTNLLLARSGTTVSGCANPHFLNDGDATNYDGSNGYAYSANNNPNEIMTITLREPTEMNHIRFLLWDRDDRFYRYILSVSSDGKTFNPLQDNSKKDSRSWQEIYFGRQKVKAVALKGIGDSASGQLHIVEVEAYNESSDPVLSDGFESPIIGPNNFQYKPKDATWEFGEQAGISGNNSGFTGGAGRAPEGGQVAFIQGNGSFSRSLDLAAGTYLLSFMDAQRTGSQQSFQVLRVSVDSKEIGTFKPTGPNFQAESKTFTVAAGKHTIAFSGVNPNGGDNSAFIDHVVLRPTVAEEQVRKRTALRGPAKSAANLKPGVWAEFFDGLDYYASADDIPDFARAQSGLDLCASTPAPSGQGLHNWPFAGACAAVFSGYVKLEKQGLYTFFLESENGSRLFIDGTLLIDNDGNHGLQETWEQIDLAAGLHRIWVEYYTTGAATGLNVSIKARGEMREFLTNKMLFYDPAESPGATEPQSKSVNLAAQPQVKFLSRDDKRGGTWQKDLGKDGYVIFNKNGGGQHLQKLPPYILALNSYADHCVWQVGQDPRGLEEPAGGGQRLCSCEYSGNEVLIEIRAARNTINRLSLYCLDFDPCGRKQKVQFSDGEKILNEMEVGEMNKGTWLHYEVAGSLNIKLINLSQTNSVIAGVFWDSDRGVHYRSPKQGQPSTQDVKPGLISEYYDGLATYPTDDDVPTFCRLEHTVAFGATPAPSGGRELHGWPFAGATAALFYGCIKIPQDDKYTFVLESDDGSRFYVDGAKLIDNDGNHPMKKVEGSVDLKAGLHRVWIEWYNAAGPFGLNLFMKQKDGKEIPIPADMLFHE